MSVISNHNKVHKLSMELSKEYNNIGHDKINVYQALHGVQNNDAMAIAILAHAQCILHLLNYPALKKDARDALGQMCSNIITSDKRSRN